MGKSMRALIKLTKALHIIDLSFVRAYCCHIASLEQSVFKKIAENNRVYILRAQGCSGIILDAKLFGTRYITDCRREIGRAPKVNDFVAWFN